MLFRRKNSNASVQPGSRFCRTHATNLIETVEVLEVCRDHRGIPHVRFEISFGWPRAMGVAAQSRLLSLQEFTNRYSRLLS